jgi:Fe-S-cluster-containing hydrogenase component 2/bacterioferritin-associated ferredoxin
MLRGTGVPTAEDLARVMPPERVRRRGAVAVFECFERIPCDPCHRACPRGAVRPFADINDLPEVDWDLCNGCGLCVAACPGLAVFVVHEDYTPATALIKLPYEFLPLPVDGQTVDALDRKGVRVGQARVIRVQRPREKAGTPVVWVEVDRTLAHVVRNITWPEVVGSRGGSPGAGRPKPADISDGDIVVCRCEDVTLAHVRQVIAEGARTLDDVKRLTRAGMGPCQGRTCRHLILQELSRLTGVGVEDLTLPTFRPPTRPIRLGVIAGAGAQGAARTAAAGTGAREVGQPEEREPP